MKWSDITPLKVMAVIIIANGTVIGGANYLKDLFDPKIVTAIVAVASLGNIFFGALVGMFSTQNNIISQVQAMPGVDKIMINAQANPALAQMAMGDDAPKVVPLPSAADAVSKIAKSVATLLLIAFLPLALLAMSSGAHAQGSRVHRSTNGQLCDPAGLLPGCPKPFASDDTTAASGGSTSTNPILNALAKPFQDLANFIGADADGAATLATQIPQLQDVNGKACWVKMQAAGAVFKAHPVPLTFQIMTDFEAFRLLQMTANDLCSYTPCTVVFSDTSNLVTAVASAVGGVLTAGLQPQSLTTLCSRIPQLAPQLPTAVTGITATSATAASQSVAQPATTSTPATAPTPSASPTPNP